MYAISAVIALVFVAVICETFFNFPVIGKARKTIDRLCNGRGYLRFFALTAVSALALYAVGVITMGAFLGPVAAASQVGILCEVILLCGMVRCWFSFGRNVVGLGSKILTGVDKRGNSEFSVFSSFIFVTAFWGCVILLTFYNHGRDGALLSLTVHG